MWRVWRDGVADRLVERKDDSWHVVCDFLVVILLCYV